jgi:hypothetical protein
MHLILVPEYKISALFNNKGGKYIMFDVEDPFIPQAAFKADETEIKKLKEYFANNGIDFREEQSDDDEQILRVNSIPFTHLLTLLYEWPDLKIAYFIDEFVGAQIRETAVCFSKDGVEELTDCQSVGYCDAQDDFPFSSQADLLQTEPEDYSGILTMTGDEWKITYSFPFADKWAK